MSKTSEALVVDLRENDEHIEMHLAVLKRHGFERALVVDGLFACPYFTDADRGLAGAVMLDWFWNGDGSRQYEHIGDLARRARWGQWRSLDFLIAQARLNAMA